MKKKKMNTLEFGVYSVNKPIYTLKKQAGNNLMYILKQRKEQTNNIVLPIPALNVPPMQFHISRYIINHKEGFDAKKKVHARKPYLH